MYQMLPCTQAPRQHLYHPMSIIFKNYRKCQKDAQKTARPFRFRGGLLEEKGIQQLSWHCRPSLSTNNLQCDNTVKPSNHRKIMISSVCPPDPLPPFSPCSCHWESGLSGLQPMSSQPETAAGSRRQEDNKVRVLHALISSLPYRPDNLCVFPRPAHVIGPFLYSSLTRSGPILSPCPYQPGRTKAPR